MKKDIPRFRQETIGSIGSLYQAKHRARYFRNVGYFLGEEHQWEAAVSCYVTSITLDATGDIAASELNWISEQTGKTYEYKEYVDAAKHLDPLGIPHRPDPIWAATAWKIAGQTPDHALAAYCYGVAHELTDDEEALARAKERAALAETEKS